MGKWDVQSLIMSSSEYFGPEKLVGEDQVPRHVKFAFKNPVRCRIIWITLRLQLPGSSSLNFENLNLLSLDENPFAEVSRRASFGGAVEREPCLHAKRILVVGSPVKKDMARTSSQGSDQMNLKSWLERDPQLNRFRVKKITYLLYSFNNLVSLLNIYKFQIYSQSCFILPGSN